MISNQKKIWNWLRERDVRLIFFSLVIFFSSWVFVEITDEVLEGESQSFDEWAIEILRNPQDLNDPIGPLWFEQVMRDISSLGSITVLGLIVSSFLVFLGIIRFRRTQFFVFLSVMSGLALSTALKSFFARPRPDLVSHGTYVLSHSFPSGHSLMSAMVYLTLAALITEVVSRKSLKSFFVILGMLFTFLIGFSRIYLGVHYPTDVLAGWSLGFAWAALCSAIARLLSIRERDLRGSQK